MCRDKTQIWLQILSSWNGSLVSRYFFSFYHFLLFFIEICYSQIWNIAISHKKRIHKCFWNNAGTRSSTWVRWMRHLRHTAYEDTQSQAGANPRPEPAWCWEWTRPWILYSRGVTCPTLVALVIDLFIFSINLSSKEQRGPL